MWSPQIVTKRGSGVGETAAGASCGAGGSRRGARLDRVVAQRAPALLAGAQRSELRTIHLMSVRIRALNSIGVGTAARAVLEGVAGVWGPQGGALSPALA